MYLKLMEGDGNFRVIEVTEISFRRLPEPMVIYKNGTGIDITQPLSNPAFLLNENGDTLEAFIVRKGRTR